MNRNTALPHVGRLLALFAALCGTGIPAAYAQTTRTVSPSGPYTTIQSAIDASSNGDTVLVEAGTYIENIDFGGRLITVVSDVGNGASKQNTIIDGSGNASLPTVRFVSGESRGTTLQGFTIRNGGGSSPTGSDSVGAIGGIYISGSSPIIAANIITGNSCFGIHAYSSEPAIVGNQITLTNVAAGQCHSPGAGVLVDGTPANRTLVLPVLQGNTIFNNNFAVATGTSIFGGSGIVVGGFTGVAIEDNKLFNNVNPGSGGAIQVSNTDSVFILDNLIVGNQAEQGAAIWFFNPVAGLGPPIAFIGNNTIVGNTNVPLPADANGDSDAQVLLRGGLAQLVVANNIIYGMVATTAGLSCSNPIPAIPPSIDTNDIYSTVGGRIIAGDPSCIAQRTQFGNVSVDPQFIDATSDFHPQSASLIDTGNTSLLLPLAKYGLNTAPDLDGMGRTQDATSKGYPQIDFGAYEASGSPNDADINALLLTASGSAGPPPTSGYEIPGGSSAQLTAAVGTSSNTPASGSVTLQRTNPDGTTTSPDMQMLQISPPSDTNPGGDSASFPGTLPQPNSAGPLPPGLYAFQASYPMPSSGSPATGIHTYILVDPYTTNLSLQCPTNPVTAGQPISVGVALTANDNTVPPGTISISLAVDSPPTFTDSFQLDASGHYTYTFTNSLPAGTHVVTFTYAGQTNYNATSNSCTISVNAPAAASTATQLTAAPTTALLGQTITFSTHTSNTASGGTAVPTGAVQLFDGSSALGAPQTLDGSGNATIPINTLSIGTHTITAVYTPASGALFASSTSNAVPVTINGQAANTTLNVSPNPTFALNPVTLTATVVSAAGGTTPSGTVTFFDGATPLGPAATLTGGAATLVWSQFTAAPNGTPLTHVLHVVYSGDSTYATATSANINEVINSNPTATSLAVSPSSTSAFQPVTLSAHTSSPFAGAPVNATPACNPACPAPSVTFFSGGIALGTTVPNAAGDASLTINPAAGVYSITAVFSGSAIFAPSTSAPASLTVAAVQPASFSLVAAPSTIIVRQTTQLTATLVLPGAPSSALSGTVLFADGGSPIGSAALTNGTVTVPYAPTTPGAHLLTAHFSGNGSLLPADATFTLTVLPQDFTITPSDGTITIRAEHHTTTAVRIDTTGGLTDTIDLSCDSLPLYLTCQFRPGQIAVGAASSGATASDTSTTSVSLYLDTDFVLGYARFDRPAMPGHISPLRTFGPAVLAVLLPSALFFGLRRRVRLPRLLLAMIVSAGVLGATGCSGLYPPHVEPGTYTILLTGHAENNNFTRTAQLTVVITPP